MSVLTNIIKALAYILEYVIGTIILFVVVAVSLFAIAIAGSWAIKHVFTDQGVCYSRGC